MLEKIIPEKYRPAIYRIKQSLFDLTYNKSYSQEGEDMVLRRIFEGKGSGFYVDVGAHHPKLYSNTYYFYKKGWRGINIDAMPGSMKAFDNVRPNDINVEAAISDKEETLTYYYFNAPALNGFSKAISEERAGLKDVKLLRTSEIKTRRLSDILKLHLPEGVKIDFMSVDVEGLDLQVLRSNDWEKYKPTYILAECLDLDLDKDHDSELITFLKSKGYRIFGKCVHTVFFKHN
jgi:FkbM family methyltransferase